MTKSAASLAFAFSTLSAAPYMAAADAEVVTDILPIHGLVSAVMDGVTEPTLLVGPGADPHFLALKPSQARALSNADLVVWIGEEMTPWLENPLETLAGNAHHLTLIDLPEGSLTLLDTRSLEDFGEDDHADHEEHAEDKEHDHDHEEHAEHKEHDHDHEEHAEDKEHGHDHEEHAEDKEHNHDHEEHAEDKEHNHDHEEHAEDKEHNHDHEEHAEDKEHDHDHEEHAEDKEHDHDHEEHAEDKEHDHDHEEHAEHKEHDHDHEEHAEHKEHDGHDDHAAHDDHGHAHDGVDPHVWLSPANAKAFVSAIEAELKEIDPGHADAYSRNAAALVAEIDAATGALMAAAGAMEGINFLVSHDSIAYLENAAGLSALGALALTDNSAPSAAHIREITERVEAEGVACLFTDTIGNTSLAQSVLPDEVKLIAFDPLGATIAPGPGHYPAMLRSIAAAFTDCAG